MTTSNQQREVRIVGYDRRLLTIQMQLLASVLLLPAMALSSGWGAAVLGVGFFLLIFIVFVQAMRLRKTGVRVRVEDVEIETEETNEAKTVPEDAEETGPEAEPAEPQTSPTESELHWSDTPFPDPDVELGLSTPKSTET